MKYSIILIVIAFLSCSRQISSPEFDPRKVDSLLLMKKRILNRGKAEQTSSLADGTMDRVRSSDIHLLERLGAPTERLAQYRIMAELIEKRLGGGTTPLPLSDPPEVSGRLAISTTTPSLDPAAETIDNRTIPSTDPSVLAAMLFDRYEVEFYPGLRKGYRATWADRSGNDLDLANLFARWLDSTAIEHVFVQRRFSLDDTDLGKLTGYKQRATALRFLESAGIAFQNDDYNIVLEQFGVRFRHQNSLIEVFPGLQFSERVFSKTMNLSFDPEQYLITQSELLPYEQILDRIKVDQPRIEQPQSLRRYSNASPYWHQLGKPQPQVFSMDRIPEHLIATLTIETLSSGKRSLFHRLALWSLYRTPFCIDFLPINDELGPDFYQDRDLFSNYPTFLLGYQEMSFLGKAPLGTGVIRRPGEPSTLNLVYPRYDGSYASDTTVMRAGEKFLIAVDQTRKARTSPPAQDDHVFSASSTTTHSFKELATSADYFFDRLKRSNLIVSSLLAIDYHSTPIVVILRKAATFHYIDALPYLQEKGMAIIDVVDATSFVPFETNAAALFNSINGITISALEHFSLEQVFGVEAVSTIKLFQRCGRKLIATYPLQKAMVQLKNTIAIPDTAEYSPSSRVLLTPRLRCNDWSGLAYIIDDPERKTRGFFISGGLRGGQTCTAIP